MLRIHLSLFILCLLAPSAFAWHPRGAEQMLFSDQTVVIGDDRDYIIAPGETLMEIARRAGIGFDNLCRANPGLDPWNPGAGRRLLLPTSALAPADLQPGITVNLAEMRLYLVWDEGETRQVRIYPVGIGREGWDTPQGTYAVSVVIEQPQWSPPASLRREKPWLPGTVPPGPDNPLGSHWIGLTAEGVGIHGTNQPFGVGRRISHGCIRLYPEDIVDLARRVSKGAPVRIIDQPIKSRVHNGTLYLEVHRAGQLPALPELARQGWDATAVETALRSASGVPVAIPATDRTAGL